MRWKKMSGKWNMLAPQAQAATGLSDETFNYILDHYSELEKEYHG